MTGDVRAAYASCQQLARAHYENFPVASLFVPRAMRAHIAAVYAFARAADDFADEGHLAPDERRRLLAGWSERLRAAAGDGVMAPRRAGEPAGTHDIFLALGATMRECRLPAALFEDLLDAFRQDVDRTRYRTWDEVFDYCRRSANPIGRLVLRIAGHANRQFDDWSDAICTALQLTNFWQDRDGDAARGRTYLPDGETLPAAIARTRQLYEAGRPLCNAVEGRLRYELRATWLGGMRVLDRVDAGWSAATSTRPVLSLADAPWLTWQLLRWPSR